MKIPTTKAPIFKPVEYVIFDMDGLLLDTETIYEGCVEKILKTYNAKMSWDVRMKILGVTEGYMSRTIVEDLNLPCTVAEFGVELRKLLVESLEHVQLMPGAERLIRHFYTNNVPFCLGTSSSNETVKVKITHHQELFSLFHHKVMGSSDPEVKEGKPAPDIFLVAAKRFPENPAPEKCLVFEDSPNGCKAARAAGMQVVMVPDSHISDKQKEHATLVLKYVIFDMDGLLLDTETLTIIQKVLDKYKPGAVFTWNVKETILGLQNDDVAKKIVSHYNLPISWQKFTEVKEIYTNAFIEKARLMPGAERLIRHLHSKNVPFCLATSSSKASVELKTRQYKELFSLFHHKVMGPNEPEVKKGKPAPDIFLVAAKKFQAKPEECLVFEDSSSGCRGAKEAGMQVVMVPNSNCKRPMINEATLVIKSLKNFKPEQFCLPRFED
ncbi:CLUMA_CG018978, isoform A [Clunio marinus]|uniref:CLUMA_CG018978, isoform A n=1 Tax=Clunio marinus TaxID=568069 RepID=A0A1J1J2K4_9DIPT|nr:CLUMA_CG018978, isoform A [Clunio marinus]